MGEINLLQIRPEDNVAVALKPLKQGTDAVLPSQTVPVAEDIPAGHKIALRPIAAGEKVIKYGAPIGVATQPIGSGSWVHTHNLKTQLEANLNYNYEPVPFSPPAAGKERSFLGFRRKDGQVGIRNELWIIPTVGCVNRACEKLAALAREKFKPEIDAGRIDGVYAFPHPYGCSQLGDDLASTQKILAGLVRHPNAGGVLVVALGCENNQLTEFKRFCYDQESPAAFDQDRLRFLIMQEVEDEIEAGLALLAELKDYASSDEREAVPVSALKVGLKCGGSDGFSGITANPLAGRVTDILLAAGGTAVLTEVPEMFGAETRLMSRARDQRVYARIVELINGFKAYFLRNGQEIYENPSPGNRDGGITTLEEKSLGCIEKGGTGMIVDVLDYGDRLRLPGLNLLAGPGNDLVSTTALAAAGVQLILFTTGRGTPLGAPVPTVKIATNSALARKKRHWIDFDAGRLLAGEDLDALAQELFVVLLQLAGGERKSRNEENEDRAIAIFKNGVTL